MDVPEPDDVNDAVRARKNALSPLLDRAVATTEAMAAIEPPHIPVTVAQYTAALSDAGVFRMLAEVAEFLHALETLDFNDPRVVGRETRRVVAEYLELLDQLQAATQRLAWFTGEDPIPELRALAIECGARGARIVTSVLQVATAATITEAGPYMATMQRELNAGVAADRLSELLDRAERELADDLDDRVSLALGLSGRYTDDYGVIDVTRVFSAASECPDPFGTLARGAGSFLRHMLQVAPDDLPESAAALTLAAVPLATLNRPFHGHKIGAMVCDVLTQAAKENAAATEALLQRAIDGSDRVFASAMRIHRELRLLATGHIVGPDDVLVGLVGIYRRLVEGSYRLHAHVLLDALDLAAGRSPSGDEPKLYDIQAALRARGGELGELVASAVDRELRNAEAHEDFSVDGTTLAIRCAGRVFDLDAFTERLEELIGAAIGLEAAVLCFGWCSDGLEVPEWIARGHEPRAAELIAQAVLAARGLNVVEFIRADERVDLVLAEDPELDNATATTVLVSTVSLFPDATVLRLVDVDGRVLAAGSARAFSTWRNAPEAMKDLALIVPLMDVAVRTGQDATEALVRGLLVCAAIIIATDVRVVLEGSHRRASLRRLSRRLGYLARMAQDQRDSHSAETRHLLASIRVARETSMAASRGDTAALPRLSVALTTLERAIADRGVEWPPY